MKSHRLALLALAAATANGAQIASTNFNAFNAASPGYNFSPVQPLYSYIAAQTFVPTDTLYLTSVDLPLNFSQIAFGPTTDTVTILDNNSGTPGAVLATSSITGSWTFDPLALRTATFTTHPQLQQGHTYFVAVQTDDYDPGRADTIWYASSVRDLPVWFDLGDGNWIPQSPLPLELAIRVWGDPTSPDPAPAPAPTPEPATWIGALPAMTLLAGARRRAFLRVLATLR